MSLSSTPDMNKPVDGDVEKVAVETAVPVNDVVVASGHVQELERNFSLLNMCATAIVVANCWAITGATIILSVYNGGAPGVIYEFIAAGLFYLIITASLAELASAIPSEAGVYHWASVTPGRRIGRVVGFFAGYWNCFAYALGSASLATIAASSIIEMYTLYHPDTTFARWQVFVIYLILIWGCAFVVLFGNKLLPKINNGLMCLCLVGWFASMIAVAALPSTKGDGYATSNFVWRKWENNTGYTSNGLVFVLGMLNGSFNIGTPDCATHLAEEMPRPEINIPKVMGIQMTTSFITTLLYLIVLFYAITDFDAVLEVTAEFPLTQIYYQVAGSKAGAVGLTVMVFLPLVGSVMGCILVSSRVFWTLARDGAVPFSDHFARVSPRWANPFNSILLIPVFCTVMGCIYLGSETAFEAFASSFVVLTTLSYLAALLPYLLSGRSSITPGPIRMNKFLGYAANIVACGYMIVWPIFYCFPYSAEVSAQTMNYSSLITGGLTILVAVWWFCIQRHYKPPPVLVGV